MLWSKQLLSALIVSMHSLVCAPWRVLTLFRSSEPGAAGVGYAPGLSNRIKSGVHWYDVLVPSLTKRSHPNVLDNFSSVDTFSDFSCIWTP